MTDYRANRLRAAKRNPKLADELEATRALGLHSVATLRAVEAGEREPDPALLRRMEQIYGREKVQQ